MYTYILWWWCRRRWQRMHTKCRATPLYHWNENTHNLTYQPHRATAYRTLKCCSKLEPKWVIVGWQRICVMKWELRIWVWWSNVLLREWGPDRHRGAVALSYHSCFVGVQPDNSEAELILMWRRCVPLQLLHVTSNDPKPHFAEYSMTTHNPDSTEMGTTTTTQVRYSILGRIYCVEVCVYIYMTTHTTIF